MASIEQIAGELNISQMYKGEALTFSTIHDGDIHDDTFAATIENGENDITVSVSATYSGFTLKTTLVYVLTKEQSESLAVGIYNWKLSQTSGTNTRLIIKGTWGIYLP